MSSPGSNAPPAPWNNVLTWTDITYGIRQGRGKAATTRQILKGLSGSVRSGEMIAIMGSSGAGKTTLLNCLSGRLSTGTLSGAILYNNRPRLPREWSKTMAFVEQHDILYSNVTVRECLRHAAHLRLPSSLHTAAEKDARADDVLRRLRLTKAADTPIGDEHVRGVSGGEKKRVAIGQELVGDPQILFLDEPTSGLDSNSALAVLENVRADSVAAGRIVVATIHQPSFELLCLFDKVILLSGGCTLYFGPPTEAEAYFASKGFPKLKLNQNPADFFMDVMTIDTSKDEDGMKKDIERIDSLARAYRDLAAPPHPKDATLLHRTDTRLDDVSLLETTLEAETKSLTRAVAAASARQVLPTDDRGVAASVALAQLGWANSWWREFGILFHRAWTQLVRGRTLIYTNLARIVVQVLILGFTFFRLKTDQRSVQNRVGVILFVLADDIFNAITSVLTVFPTERAIMLRERAARSYRVSSFFLAKAVAELIPALIYSLMSCIPIYLIVGLRLDRPQVHLVKYAAALAVQNTVNISVGLLIGAAVPSVQVANVVGPLVATVFLIYGGSFINNADLPVIFRGFQYITPGAYTFRALMQNEFGGLSISCPTDPSEACAFENGDQVLATYSVASPSFWVNVGGLAALFCGYITLAYLTLRFAAKPKVKLV
ncbi:ATP-binding cassette sub- G member 2 [Phlyctochytrium bullatum]|nr:ATP-binding cassette sub- G member 2 [Phlyctochytrium bullatum]